MNLLTILIYAEDTIKVNESIQSIYKFADQIILISSSDIILDDFEICHHNIIPTTSKVDNLNSALKHCNSKWVLYLNSGEILFSKAASNIRDLISSANSNCGGYLCRMENAHTLNDSGSSTGFYPRLFLHDASNEHFFKGALFEQSSFAIIESGKSIYPCDLSIIQTDTNDQTNLSKSITLLKQFSDDIQNEYYWYELGLTYAQNNDLSQAEEAFIKVFDYHCSHYIKELASLALSNICRREKRIEEAILWAEMAYDLAKDKTYSLQALANAYLWNQDAANAKKYFQELEKRIKEDSYQYYYIEFPQIIIDKGLEDIEKIESFNLH